MPELSTSVTTRAAYYKAGTGPALVLLHGFPERGSLWAGVWGRLAATFTVIVPDMPGSGDSVLEQETRLPMVAEMVKEILDAEGIASAIFAGHSMGGYVSLAFARLFPGMVQGLSLVHSTPAADDEERKAGRIRAAALVRSGGKELFLRQTVPGLFSAAFKERNAPAIDRQIDRALQISDDALVNFYDAMRLRGDSSDVLENASFPVQWIMGKDDNIISYKKILPETHRSAINFVSFYDRCGHMSMIEAPERLVADLEEFGNYCHRAHERMYE